MNYLKIKFPDVANGPGVRVSLFVSGCICHCPGCFNPESWDPAAGKPFTCNAEREVMRYLDRPEVAGLSILGGEPLLTSNLQAVHDLVWLAKAAHPEKPLWVWTGNTYEELQAFLHLIIGGRRWADTRAHLTGILKAADVLVDGPYIEAEKDLTLRFRGSRNQRIIDLRATEAAGHIVRWAEEDRRAEPEPLNTMEYTRRAKE